MGNSQACHPGPAIRPSYFPINASGQQEQFRNASVERGTSSPRDLESPSSAASLLGGSRESRDSRLLDNPDTESHFSTGGSNAAASDAPPATSKVGLREVILGSALLLLGLGVSAYAAKDFLHVGTPQAWGPHRPEVQTVQRLAVLKQPAPRRECCDKAIAECLACTAGLSVERYCSVPQTSKVDGCEQAMEEERAAHVEAVEEEREAHAEAPAGPDTTTAPASSRSSSRNAGKDTEVEYDGTAVEGDGAAKEERWRPHYDCCTTATAPCVACALGMTVQEYCGAKGTGSKAPGCEEGQEAETGEREEEGQEAETGEREEDGSKEDEDTPEHKERIDEELGRSKRVNKEQADMEQLMHDQYEQMQKQLLAHETERLERQKRRCCTEHTAKCLACAAGLSLAEYCADGGGSNAPGCEELAPSTVPPTTTVATTTQIVVVIRGVPPQVTTTTTSLPGLSLFCFALMLPWGYESSLLRSQLKVRKSIFGCDESAVYSSTVMDLGRGFQTRNLGIDLHCKYGGEFHTVLNTPIFRKVWQRVVRDGLFRKHDWTVKADPDTVFIPKRLQQLLRGRDQMVAEVGNGTFLNNCGYGLHGPLEVLSRRAIEVYAQGVHLCDQPPQEDVYLQKCMLTLGVLQVNHFNLLAEAHCSFEDWAKCTSDHVSFHPFKNWTEYDRCLHAVESRE